MERWLPVVGFEGLYEVSDHGRVRSLDRETVFVRKGKIQSTIFKGKLLWYPPSDIQGTYHPLVVLYRDSIRYPNYIHCLVLEAFDKPRPEGKWGLHHDDNPWNNHISNLYWGSPPENQHDSIRNGTHGQARKTHCPHGHEYTEENTWYDKNGWRFCRTCNREKARRRYTST